MPYLASANGDRGKRLFPLASLAFKVCSIFWPRGLNPKNLSCTGMTEDHSTLEKVDPDPTVMDNRETNQWKSHHLYTHMHPYKGATFIHRSHGHAWMQERLVPSGNIIWELVHLLFLRGCCLIIYNLLEFYIFRHSAFKSIFRKVLKYYESSFILWTMGL